ncbi:MAG: carboxynorspermidine decarboxylase [Oscillospiraceae bacterium]|nr:carboxynorspermidine decarboxylase [Oscillospiraceae bacterium]
MTFDISSLHTPCYVVDKRLIRRNMEILDGVRRRTGAKILLAQKAFSMWSVYPEMAPYIDGTTSSGLYEARLGREEMPDGQVHIFSPAYRDDEFDEIASTADHIVFNTPAQYLRFADRTKGASCAIRVDPEYSEQEHEIYDPCSPLSRLGTRAADMYVPEGIEGLLFHTLCEQDSDALEHTVQAFNEKFARYMEGIRWLDLGGGHHITREGYDIDRLCRVIDGLRERYGCEIYLEPGEAHALNAGYLVTEVLDIFVKNGIHHVILDTSAACHMPDVLEMPYRPPLTDEDKDGAYEYMLGAPTCLAGDRIGSYRFSRELHIGDRLVFGDMAIYTMVKNNTFNGMSLPWIYTVSDEGVQLVRSFGYEDFKGRLS